jgi:hypothetical protein
MDLKEIESEDVRGLAISRLVAWFCEHGKEIPRFIEFWEVSAQPASEEGDIPKKISEDELTANSIIMNSFYN